MIVFVDKISLEIFACYFLKIKPENLFLEIICSSSSSSVGTRFINECVWF